jgi:hypothetical protein
MFLKYFRNWKLLAAAPMQTRVQVYYGSHAIRSYENRTTAEHQQDKKCKIVKLSEKAIGIFDPTLELVSPRTFHNESHLSKPETRKIPITVNTRLLQNK